MLQAQTSLKGLDLIIQDACELALRAGRHDLADRLERVLATAGERDRPCHEVDLLAGEIRRDGSLIRLSRGERALLFVLSLQRKPCNREELVEMLYPQLDAAVACVQLKVYVHRVRRRMQDDGVVIFQKDSYRLGKDVRVDLWETEGIVAAVMRTHGALDDATRIRLDAIRYRLLRRDLSWFDDREWCSRLQRRLESLLFDVTVRLGESALACEDTALALKLSSEIFDLDPCDERGAELAMRAHLSAGNHAEALRHYRRFERALREEFGAKPSTALNLLIASKT
jgi:DNA-binding SARP family transcriptional activator